MHRAGIAALAIVAGLRGEAAPLLRMQAAPVRVTLEGASEIDDIDIELSDSSHVYVQAKRSGNLGAALAATAKQWAAARKAGRLKAVDRAIMAVAEPSGTLRELGAALDARRESTPLTVGQQQRLRTLTNLLAADLDGVADVDAVLDVTHVVEVNGHPDSASMEMAAAFLDGTVVTAGQGRAAVAALRGQVPVLAARHGSSVLEEWRRWLREAQVPAHADPHGVVAARAQAADDAIAEYRVRLGRDRDVLPLTAFIPADPLPVPGLAAGIRVVHATDPDAPVAGGRRQRRTPDSVSLLALLRREGRLLLVGQPGAGKSVAVRQVAAHFAATDPAPLPVIVSLKRLAELLPADRSRPLQVSELTALAVPDGEQVLRAALEERIAAGHVVMLLDGLDETEARRDRVIEELRNLLSRLSRDLDVLVTSRHVLVTSRHSAAAAPSACGFVHVELEQPQGLSVTVRRLLRHLAPELPGDDRESWLEQRAEYIERSREDEPALWSAPLLATLAVLLLTDRAPEQMPRTRARLLHEVIRYHVRTWSARRADATLPGLDAAMSAEVLIDTFADVASAVADGGIWQEAHGRTARRLTEHWGQARGAAEGVANAVLDHWDLTAGVFVTASARGQLTARTRLFTEIGEALLHTRDDHAVRAWMEQVLDHPERRETLRLAAGLTPAAAATLAALTVERGGAHLDLVCDAWADGAELTSEDQHRVITAQLERLASEPTDPPSPETGLEALLRERPSPFATLAVRLAELPLSDAQVQALMERCTGLPGRQRDVIAALAAASRAGLDPAAPDERTLDLLEAALLTEDEYTVDDEKHAIRSDRSYGLGRVAEAALRLLVPSRPGCATRVAQTAYNTSLRTYERTEAALRRRGLDEALAGVRRRLLPNLTWNFSKQDMDQPFVLLRDELGEEAVKLTPSQAWHLDEASALIGGLGTSDRTLGDLLHAAHEEREVTLAIVRAYADAAGVPLSVVASQLEQLYAESPDDPDYGLLYSATNRMRVDPVAVTEDHLAKALLAWLTGNPWLVTIALDLHLHASQLNDDHVQRVLDLLPQMTAWARRDAAIAVAYHRPDVTLPTADVAVRAGAARVTTGRCLSEGNVAHVLSALSDSDLWVRESAADMVQGVSADVAAELQAALDAPATQWTCPWCDAVRTADMGTCPEPHTHPRPKPVLGGRD